MQGRSVSQGLDAGRCREGGEMCACAWVCVRTQAGYRGARGSQGSSAPVLACGPCLHVRVLETH